MVDSHTRIWHSTRWFAFHTRFFIWHIESSLVSLRRFTEHLQMISDDNVNRHVEFYLLTNRDRQKNQRQVQSMYGRDEVIYRIFQS